MTSLDYALAYAAKGWRVFPVHGIREIKGKLWCTCSDPNCNHQGKHPIAKLAPKGRNDATTDAGAVTRWWQAASWANIGIATGKDSGLVVIDVDIGKGKVGDETLEALEAQHGRLPDTVLSLTGSGGQHYLFRYPADAEKLKSATNVLGPSIDSRADGGYIVAPPSRHISGGEYLWEGSSDPTEGAELAELPAWVRQLLEAQREEPPVEQGSGRLSEVEIREIRAALSYINPDDRDTWLQVGMGLHSTSAGEQAYGLWCEWSQGSDKYNAADQRRVWASFKTGGVTKRTLFDMAQKAGWLNTAKRAANGSDKVVPINSGRRRKEQDQDDKPGWQQTLTRSDKGALHCSVANVARILQHDPAWQGALGWDEFALKVIKRTAPPFAIADTGEWNDRDDSKTAIWLSDHYDFRPSSQTIYEAVAVVAEHNRYHPVREYLTGLQWDGRPRAVMWMIRYLGAPDTPYVRLVGGCWLVAAVARIFQPGCKMDNVLILEGDQGAGKSSALRILGGEWFTDTPFELGSRDGFMAMRGHWIIELAELDSFNRAESTRAKQFFAAHSDTYREPYGRRTQDVPRQCVFAGSTNAQEYLRDETGNRRYWPVPVRAVRQDELARARDQLWAEAVAMYRNGEQWWIEPTLDYVQAEQEQRYSQDAWEARVKKYIDDQYADYKVRHYQSTVPFYVTVAQILGDCLEIPAGKWTRADQMRVSSVLKRCGLIRKKYVTDEAQKKTEWGYGFRFS